MKILVLLSLILAVDTFSQEARLYQNKGNKFNPSIGINSLFLYKNTEVNSEDEGMGIQEMEMQFVSDVDSYFLVNALFALRNEDGEFIIEPEEAFLETTSIKDVTFRVGKFRMGVGKHNQLHTHAYPFIDAPLTQKNFLGEEGLQEVGISASYLIPTNWYSEVILQAVQGDNDNLFNSANKNEHAYLARLVNMFDLSKHSTIEFSLTGMTGRNSNEGAQNLENTRLFGGDMTIKWKPSKYKSFIWSTEYLQREISIQDAGVFSYMQYQLAERWYLGYRFGRLGLNAGSAFDKTRHSAIATFASSEFGSIRTQYSIVDDAGLDDNQFLVQFNMSIGAHPAHRY